MFDKQLIIVFFCCILLFGETAYSYNQPVTSHSVKRDGLSANDDFVNSPYTGYTREQWLEISEKIIAGALSHFDRETGMPDLAVQDGFLAYEQLRMKTPIEGNKRILERMMMAVLIYTKATGKDEVPGYEGSISQPFIDAIIVGTDPDNPNYWGDPPMYDQVGSTFAMAAYIEPERYWDPLSDSQKKKLLIFLQKQVQTRAYDNNHYYFHTVPVELLEKNGLESNRDYLTRMNERLMGWYRGDGWFLDGSNRGFDYYNLWGFQLFNQVLYKYNLQWQEQFGERIKFSTERFLETLPYLYGRDGGPIPWGRSLSYRFAGNSAIAWAVINNMSTLPPGQARRIASGSLKYFWEHGCLDDNNLLAIGYWEANASIAEPYLCYGDGYWATHGLACLLIPETDPFWTSVEEPIPADLAGGTMAVHGAQFSLRVNDIDGEARMFPAGQPWAQSREKWQSTAKYDQHAYSSYLGFCVLGEGGGQLGAGRSGYSYDGVNWFYRERAKAIRVSDDHLVSTYTLHPKKNDREIIVENRDEIITHTLVGNDGEIHVFWHNYPDPIYLYLGGYGLSMPESNDLAEKKMNNFIHIDGGEYCSVVQAIQAADGKFESEVLIPRDGWKHTHLFGGIGAFPFWRSNEPVPPNLPQVFYVNGAKIRNVDPVDAKIQTNQGILNIQFEGNSYSIQIPY
jgi:hypothetical protein